VSVVHSAWRIADAEELDHTNSVAQRGLPAPSLVRVAAAGHHVGGHHEPNVPSAHPSRRACDRCRRHDARERWTSDGAHLRRPADRELAVLPQVERRVRRIQHDPSPGRAGQRQLEPDAAVGAARCRRPKRTRGRGGRGGPARPASLASAALGSSPRNQ